MLLALDTTKILESRKLPTLPAVAVKLLKQIGSRDSDRQEIAETIKSDPGIAARVLQTANSAYFGLRAEVRSIDQAVFLLGPGTLTSLCLTFSLSNFSYPGSVAAQGFRSVWEQSILRAIAAETIAKACKIKEHSACFLQAMLCDVGRLAILAVEPEVYQPIFEQERAGADSITVMETQLLGTDHVELGVLLGQKWGLPELFVTSIRYHHASVAELAARQEDENFQSLVVVTMASLLAEFILFGQTPSHYEDLLEMAKRWLEMDESEVNDLISDVRMRADDVPSEFNIDSSGLPAVEELMEKANELLVSACMRAEAVALSAIADRDELAAKNSSLNKACEQLEEQASVDYLTRLYNRSYFDAFLSDQITHPDMDGKSVGVILCDIDRFKSINDTLGHQIGDAVLQSVAIRIRDAVGSQDVVARYGGEEFIVATSGRSPAAVREIAEAIRANVADSPIVTGTDKVPVTLSAGYSTNCAFNAGELVSRETLVAAADEALYQAKNNGRNRVIGWRAGD